MAISTEDLGERVSRLEGGYEHLATKADLANVKAELKADIAEVRSELKADVAEVKTDLGQVKAQIDERIARIDERIARMENRLLIQFSGIAFAAVAAAVGFSQLLG